jgi:ABC-type phosphate transport system auxiliary subunit
MSTTLLTDGIRQFQDLEEVLENLDTLTHEECVYCSDVLGICFDIENGKITDAYYGEEAMNEQTL